jgi:hypothetical protein
MNWKRSSYSGSNGQNCAEVARNVPRVVAVRDSKNADGPKLVFSPAAWQVLTAGVKVGRHDLG